MPESFTVNSKLNKMITLPVCLVNFISFDTQASNCFTRSRTKRAHFDDARQTAQTAQKKPPFMDDLIYIDLALGLGLLHMLRLTALRGKSFLAN